MAIKVSIIILDYKKAQRVLSNVEGLLRQKTDFEYHIFVIDNSCDAKNAQLLQTLEQYPQVQVFINSENKGYPRAHNQVSHLLKGEYVLIVNPDIVWKSDDTLQKMVEFMDEHPGVGIMGPKQVNDDGSLPLTVRAFPKFHVQVSRRTFLRKMPFLNKEVEFDEMRHLNYSKPHGVDWLQSSCVIVRKDLWNQVGGFSEDYFIFMSDVELCFKSWEKGLEVVYLPSIEVGADGKRASSGGFRAFFRSPVLRQHVKDALVYQWKHFNKPNPRKEFLKKSLSCVEQIGAVPMKGIILAGGNGTRLHPLTKVTSKQLLPIYNKPMIYYPLETLIQLGIKDILIIVAPDNAGDFLKLLGSGKEFGVHFTYEIQDKPNGIAEAFLIGENFIGKDNVALILGDNIFEDNFNTATQEFHFGAKVFVKKVHDASRFGVVECNIHGTVLSIEEKPKNPKSNLAQTGLYFCDNTVIERVKNMKPSKRGELEITDVMNMYLKEKSLVAEQIQGSWFDTGTHESMFHASEYMRKKVLSDSKG